MHMASKQKLHNGKKKIKSAQYIYFHWISFNLGGKKIFLLKKKGDTKNFVKESGNMMLHIHIDKIFFVQDL